ncbi:hypothetical protein A4A49_30779 [Nicotiana attenuata]|uniref:MBD domain-containing protein n=1 Tax=Nicotiana attenuata TaxID=49451 RepID=A0A1J6IZE3_NICAT|nr:hypothetical protein A4A49_30779 [Nicotiana attenuata]
MVESFNYSDFEDCCSPIVSDVSLDPVLEAYREARRAKKSKIEKADEADDAQSKPTKSVVEDSQMENKEPVIISSEEKNHSQQETGQLDQETEQFVQETGQFVQETGQLEQETGQSSNANEEVQKKRRKRRKSSNGDDDSWLPEGWKKVETCRRNGKTAGYVDKSYKAPGVGRAFRSKKAALEYIEKQKLAESDRANESLEDPAQGVQDGGIQTPIEINDQAITSQVETCRIDGGDAEMQD